MSKLRLLSRSEVDIDVWEERDRLSIVIKDKKTGQRTIAEWWDDDARQMFEDGFFKRGVELKRSVIAYAEEVGLLSKPGSARLNPSGAPNMVWTEYLKISLRRIYKVSAPRRISNLPGWVSIQTGTRLVIDALRQKFGAMDYNDPRVQTVIQMAKSMELVKNNPGKVRENIYLFNNPGNAQRILAENFVKGANSGVASSMYIHGNRIYSYGPHFPIAERHVVQSQPVVGTPVIIITNRKSPSKTTSGQIGLVKAAAQAAGMDVMYEELKPEAKGPAAYSNPRPLRGGEKHIRCVCGRTLSLDEPDNSNGDVECSKCGQWYNAFGQKLKDPSQWERNPGVRNPKEKVRENVFLFNNPRGLNTVEKAAAAVGLVVGTWAPGDGVTRYRFFLADGKSSYGDYHQGDGLYTALGRKDAMAFISAYGKGRGAKASSKPTYVIDGFTHQGRRGQTKRYAEFKTTSMDEARARAEQIFRETGVVVAIVQKNPLTRSEAGYLLRHARADVLEAGAAKRFGLTHEAKYAAGHARGIGFAVQETGPKAARKTWVDIHTKLDRTLRNPCSNPIVRGDKLPAHLQEEALRRYIYRWTTGNSRRGEAYGFCKYCMTQGGRPSENNLRCRQVHPTIPLISDKEWLKTHAFHITKDGRFSEKHNHAEPGYMADAEDGVLPNPLLQTVMMANPPISQQWDRMTGRQRFQLLGFIGFPPDMASAYARYPWATLNASAKRGLERQWLDSTHETHGGTTRRRSMAFANPLTDEEAERSLKYAKRSLYVARKTPKTAPKLKSFRAGEAHGQAVVIHDRASSKFYPEVRKILKDSYKQIGVRTNPGSLRLPKPGTKMTVAAALELARRIGDRGLIEQCQKALKLQKVANRNAKCVIWKTFPMGSSDKIDSVVALTHYGDSPETMYQPPKGSKKGNHMYRHKWGETGGKKSVPLLASADGKMLLMPLEGKKVASDWLRH